MILWRSPRRLCTLHFASIFWAYCYCKDYWLFIFVIFFSVLIFIALFFCVYYVCYMHNRNFCVIVFDFLLLLFMSIHVDADLVYDLGNRKRKRSSEDDDDDTLRVDLRMQTTRGAGKKRTLQLVENFRCLQQGWTACFHPWIFEAFPDALLHMCSSPTWDKEKSFRER